MFLYVYPEEIKSRCHYPKPIPDGSLNLRMQPLTLARRNILQSYTTGSKTRGTRHA